jgi:hypothetical protein
MDSNLYQRITTALLGQITDCYDVTVPADWKAGALPTLVGRFVGGSPTAVSMTGSITWDRQLEVTVYSTDLAAARTVRAALVAALHHWTAATIKVCRVLAEGQETYEPEAPGPCYAVRVEFVVVM